MFVLCLMRLMASFVSSEAVLEQLFESDFDNTSLVSSEEELEDNLDSTIDDGSLVYPWREAADRKYTKLS